MSKIVYVVADNTIVNAIVVDDDATAADWSAIELPYPAGIGWTRDDTLDRFIHPSGIIEEPSNVEATPEIAPEVVVYTLDDELRALVDSLDD